MAEIVFPPGAFRRIDEEDDRLFYASPRRTVHLDDAALAALTRLYAMVVPPTGCVLDLMAAWRSHLPPWFRGTLIGLGLNRTEMRDNPQLGQALVHDLNQEPALPVNDAAFDAALCAVSVQYMTRPLEVFREVHRALKPGAPFVVSFSNRCFPEKAVALWQAANDAQHAAIVTAYFQGSGGWEGLGEFSHTPADGDPLFAVWGMKVPS
jgi:SAM-dependent methyltransferase